jgi:hypothetical protein
VVSTVVAALKEDKSFLVKIAVVPVAKELRLDAVVSVNLDLEASAVEITPRRSSYFFW